MQYRNIDKSTLNSIVLGRIVVEKTDDSMIIQSVHFFNGCIEVIGNRKQLKRGDHVRIEGRLISKISRTAIYQKILADEVMRL